MGIAMAGIPKLPQAQIRVSTETGAPKTQFNMKNTSEMMAFEQSRIQHSPASSFTEALGARREGYQSGYTKDDALASLWRTEHTRVDLSDPTTWENLSCRQQMTQEALDSLQQELEQNGLSGQVDWAGLSRELDSFRDLNGADLADGMDFFASRYVALRDQLSRNFSGDALTAQQEKLDAAYEKGVSYFVDGYADKIGQQLGLTADQGQGVRESLEIHLAQKISDYQSALLEWEPPSDPTDAWLQNHDAYMAAQLRASVPAEGAKRGAGAFYTMDDLTAACGMGEAYQAVTDNAAHGTDEVRMALDMGLLDMKSEALTQSGKVSSQMAALLKNTQSNRHQAVVDAANQRLSDRRNDRLSGEPEGSFAPIDQSMLRTVYQSVMDTFRQSGGNAVKAIHQGVETAKTVTAAAHGRLPEVSRWGNSMNAWLENFHTPRQASGLEQAAHALFGTEDKNNSPLQDYADHWQHFLSTTTGSASSWYLGAGSAGIPAYRSAAHILEGYA